MRSLSMLIIMTSWSLMGAAAAQSDIEPGTVFRDCDGCPEMVVIPTGSFIMGSPVDEVGRDRDEGPQHLVTIPRAFVVGRFEVTVGEFHQFVAETGYRTGGFCQGLGPATNWRYPGFVQTDENPVVCVDWENVQAYLQWLSERAGVTYRLLSEAEWEYSARAGSAEPYAWGGTPSHDYMNSPGISGRDEWQNRSAPVGSFPPNAFNLYDMHGNAWEWVEDCEEDHYRGAPTDGSASLQGDCRYRMMRGGSWSDHPRSARSANRGHRAAHRNSDGRDDLGFRVTRDLAVE